MYKSHNLPIPWGEYAESHSPIVRIYELFGDREPNSWDESRREAEGGHYNFREGGYNPRKREQE